MTVKAFYNKGYVYNERAPYFVYRENLTEQQWSRLTQSKSFCMLPWVHMHAFPDGRAYPCCLSEYWHPVGDLRKNTMLEIWNQDAYKTMRQNMLTDKPCKECTKCYEQEANGFFSMRYDSNRNYGHHIAEVDQTTEDGTNPFWFGSSQLSGQNYRDVFVIGTEDGGLNWTYPVNITRSAHFEEAFASTPEVLTGTTLPVLYQADIEPGTIMQNADVYDPTFQNVMILQSVSIDDIFTEGALATAPCGQSELPLGIKTIVSKNFDALKIWPNPASDLLHVDLPVNYSGSNSVCNIFDMTGRKVIEAKLNSRKEINISSLTPGMYQVQVTGSNKSYTAKFVKE